jgi:chromate transporter
LCYGCSTMMQNPRNTASLSDVFLSFLRLGATAFGGPAIVPHIRVMAVERKGWIDAETFDRGNALAQVVPGAISVQVAAFVGLQIRGFAGAAAACTGYVLPAFLFMLGLAALYEHWRNAAATAAGFSGLRAVVLGILGHAALVSGRMYLKNGRSICIAISAAMLFGLSANPLLVILVAGVAGWLILAGAGCPQTEPGIQQKKPWLRQAVLLLCAVAAGFGLLYLADAELFSLALLMFKIDFFAFGGGYTSVPLMFHEIVEVRSWLDGKTLLDGIALGQLTPGPIVITATFVGYLLKGVPGAAAATACIFLPSFLIVVLLSPGIDRLRSHRGVDGFMQGILCSFVGLLASTVFLFGRHMDWTWGHGLLMAGACAALAARIPILLVVLGGIAAALALL